MRRELETWSGLSERRMGEGFATGWVCEPGLRAVGGNGRSPCGSLGWWECRRPCCRLCEFLRAARELRLRSKAAGSAEIGSRKT